MKSRESSIFMAPNVVFTGAMSRRQLIHQVMSAGAGAAALAMLAACGGTASVVSTTGTTAASASLAATSSSAAATTSAPAATVAPLAITAAPVVTASTSSSASATAAATTAASASAASASVQAGTLIVGRSGDSVKIDPNDIEDGESTMVTTEIFDSLVKYSPKQPPLTIQPALAEAWDISSDNLQLTFKLRQGVKFHDGTDFNADAVMFTFQRMSDPTNPYHKGQFVYWHDNFGGFPGNLKSIDKIDNNTVKLTLSQPDGEILPKLSLFFCNIISPTAFKKDPVNFFKNPVGTGPFKFKEWLQGDHITVTANPDYWGGPPKLNSIIWRVIPDNAARAAEMQAGSIQVGEIAAVDIPNLQKNSNITIIEQPAVSTGYLALNLNDPTFKDLRVRQAFAYAINRQPIVDAFYGGLGQVPTQFQPPSILGYNAGLKFYDYNPTKAMQLLKDAGQANLTIDFWYMSVTRGYFPDPKGIAQAIASDLAKVGIKVNLKTEDWAAYLSDRTKGKFGLYMLGWGSDNGDPDDYLGYFFKAVKPEFSYDNAKLRDLLTKADQVIDPKLRTPYYQQAAQILNDDVPVIPIAWAKGVGVARKNVQGYTDPLFTELYHDVTVS
jgi:peptide/nickel transport system substrate-binding protein